MRRPFPVVFGSPIRSSSALVLIASIPRTHRSTLSRRGSASRAACSAAACLSLDVKLTMSLTFKRQMLERERATIRPQ
jgi:hypothetical protein